MEFVNPELLGSGLLNCRGEEGHIIRLRDLRVFTPLSLLLIFIEVIDYELIILIAMSILRGDVVTMECVEKIIKKDWIHPLTSEKLSEKDVIPLQRVSV